jgi:hypothetical protein
MATTPPIPQRRIDLSASAARRGGGGLFWRNTSGRRLAAYAFGLLALIIVQFRGMMTPPADASRSAAPQASDAPADSRAASRPVVEILHPPTSFLPDYVRHELRAVPDEIEDFSDFGAASIFKYLQGMVDPTAMVPTGPEGAATRPSTGQATDLVNAEALAEPERFRGGMVRSSGKLVRFRTLGFKPGVVPDDLIYQGFLVGDPQSPEGGVMFLTLIKPPEYDRAEDTLEVEGVFLQNSRYEAVNGAVRRVPCLVATSIRILPREGGEQVAMGVYGTGAVVIVGLGALIIRFLMSRDSRLQNRVRQMPPRRPAGGTNAP